ncbi:10063_t:CDS:2 [Scutellospora calospora]|uniref:10063_t:CDS:1 n=1 Tax=Scutellospora calospora TaxID=85575 RepID=A0ACA9P8N2_9GLOM|nr:10063_t:CDS:2 [Scutellospora calospora]
MPILERPGVEPREGVVPREGGMPLMPLKGVPLRLNGVPAWLRDGPRDMEAPYCDAEGGKDEEWRAYHEAPGCGVGTWHTRNLSAGAPGGKACATHVELASKRWKG